MRAPKGHTNQPSRKLSTYVAPYQEEWVRAKAAAMFPADVSTPYAQRPVFRFLRQLIEQAMEAEATR